MRRGAPRPGRLATRLLNMSRRPLIQRFTHALRNTDWIVVHRKCHCAFKAVRTRDENAKPAFERVSRDPGFMRSLGVLAARDHGRFDALATVAGDPFDVEDRDRHTAQL